MPPPDGRPSPRAPHNLAYAIELILIAIGYLVTAKVSLGFASVNASASPIWPPTGLALGLMLLRGYRIWPAILAGAIVANVGISGWIALAIGAGNTLEALTGAWLVNWLAKGVQAFRSPLGVGKFAVIAGALATPLSATIGVVALTLGGHAVWASFREVWITWWLGDFAGAVVVAPVLVLWVIDPPRLAKPSGATLEYALVILLTAVVGFACVGPGPRRGGEAALAFAAVLPLVWSALRLGERDTATVALILSGFAVWGVAAGGGPFIQPGVNDSYLLLVAFMISAAGPSLALSAGGAVRDRALASSEEHRRLLLDNIQDHAIFMLDAGGRVATWNSGATRVYGYAADEIVGQPAAALAPDGSSADELDCVLAQVAEAGKLAFEAWRVRRDGGRFLASIVISAVRDENGALVGYAKITRDVSEQRRVEEALEHTREQLAQSQKLEALGRLTGGIAHDFNNLLMIIGGQADLLSSPAGEERRRRAAEAIKAAVDRGANLSRQLLSFSRRQILTPEVIELPSRLQAMRGMLKSSVGEAVELIVEADPDVRPIEADGAELELALINLAVNARDAMQEGGRLTITARNLAADGSSGDMVALSITDTGEGMTAEVLAKAFDPFFTTKAMGKGAGLGLSQVHGFARQSGGEAIIESHPGQGCTVRLVLPRARRPAAAGPQVSPAEPPGPIGGAVLLVEDNCDVAEVTSALLERLGCRVVHEATASEAIGRLDAGESFDLVLSDIVMPGPLNGLALAQRIRARHPGLPVLLATGYSDEADLAEVGFTILRKPFDLDALACALSDALEPIGAGRAGAAPGGSAGSTARA